MSSKKISVSSVIEFLGSQVLQVHGNIESKYFSHLKPSSKVDADTLDWVHYTNKAKQSIAESSAAKIVIADPDVEFSSKMKQKGKVLIIVGNPKLCLVQIGNHFFVKKPIAGLHPSAFIHSDAKIGENCFIGAGAYIGACTIGNNVNIYENAAINDDVIIGNNVSVKPGAKIGYEGFGFEKDENNNLVRFPQIGSVIIHDNVEIGANTCIDKGSLSDTIIGFNSKINNLCHIAHNVVIGENVIITALVNISGSTVIGDYAWISPAASFKGHQQVGSNAIVGMGAVVTKDVPSGEIWFGNPAKKIK